MIDLEGTVYTIATGSPWDGMSLTGLFDSEEDAMNYAENYHDSVDWWIVTID